MSTQPEALRLADALEELDAQFSFPGACGEAATELRRLLSEALRIEALHAQAQRELQDLRSDIETLYQMYEQACRQRDELMNQQRAQIEAMRGRLQ
jgi:Skp family chaperone for outer membrane proteins